MPGRGWGRTVISSLAACALVVTAGGIDAAPGDEVEAQNPARPPNILVIVTDDQRAGTLNVMPTTRHYFKRNGTRFPNAFVSTPLCCPARASIFSGRYAHNHGIFRTSTDPAVFDHEATMQARLQTAGYRTAISGKFINNWDRMVNPPYFDRLAFFSRGLHPNSDGYYDLRFNVDGRQRTVRQYSTTFIRNRALEFLEWFEQDDNRPWFLYVAPFAPHPPATPDFKYLSAPVPRWEPGPAAFEADVGDKPEYVQLSNAKRWRMQRARRNQLRTLMSVDDMVARLFAELDRLGEKQDTMAVFMSDNGFMWGEHRRSGKSVPYTESTRIPLLIRWPGKVRRGAADARLASNVDIAPTALDAAGLSAGTMDGRSLLDKTWRRDRVLLEFWQGSDTPIPGWASLRTSGHQYTEYYGEDEGGEVVIDREYYDLSADPWQLNNLVADDDPTNEPPQWMVDVLRADRNCAPIWCP